MRRHRFLSFLFIGCLAIALFAGSSASSQIVTTVAPTQPQIAQSPASSQTGLTQPPSKAATDLSLTAGVRKTVLDNGLTVLTKEVHTSPVVSVQVWYRVGSRNEAPGVNGIAHQLEHLLFKGTQSRPIQFGRFFSALGSDSNAFTSYDMTAYYGTVEQDKLEALLVLEADRMKNSIISEKELASEKRVVISELQGNENSPSYRLGRAVMRSAFPTSPYGLPVGGTKADVEKFTVDQVRYYYNNFYRPDNATLVVVGDFQTDALLKQVQESFGKISKAIAPLPKDPLSAKPDKAALQSPASAPIILKEPGSAPLLNAVYPLPNTLHPDVAAIQVMDYILTGGRSSRIHQALVETGLASDAGGGAANLISGGWYELSATAAPGKDLQEIDRALQQVLADLRDQGVTQEELTRAKAQLKASLILRNRDIASQANLLGDNQISTGDYRFTDKLLAAIATVTPADVQRVAKTYLATANRTVGFFEPTTADGKPGASPDNSSQTSEKFSPGAPVDPAELAKYLPPTRTTTQQPTQALPEKLILKNGVQVLLVRDRSTPTVSLSGHVAAGTVRDQAATAGLATLTANNLMNGTQTKDALAIAKTLENRGASLDFGASREGVSISGEALSTDLPTLVQITADVLRNASFPKNELELSRQRALSGLKLELDTPSRLARRAFQQAIYPANHPFHTFPTAASLQAITREDIVRFHQQYYRPEATVLTIVGDFDLVAVRALLTREFGSWAEAGNLSQVTFPVVPLPDKTVRLMPTLPGKTQSITYMGYNAIDRRDPRYYSALVFNQILGGDTLSSRLGTEIRDRQGLTYGIYSGFQAGQTPGPFLISMQTAPEDADRAIASTISLLQQIRKEGVTAEEVANAKRSLTSSYSVELASPNNLASTILSNAVYGLPLSAIRTYTATINAITPAQVNALIEEILQPDRLVIVTAGPNASSPQK
ncbi:insulinase family protein [Phormidium sp. CLA17]|uniref:M16 family metallopeptidase n=1 Tax=Leptolyngbya sp. Cla-17 TaxID=2803751 RepID=UPI001490DFE0|nr:pitrilysin family protein [Leptolyngbya sp. Cla-17]MBM0741124.1 insulinase family protein [Leptolyngbya sp. Cla-17]